VLAQALRTPAAIPLLTREPVDAPWQSAFAICWLSHMMNHVRDAELLLMFRRPPPSTSTRLSKGRHSLLADGE